MTRQAHDKGYDENSDTKTVVVRNEANYSKELALRN